MADSPLDVKALVEQMPETDTPGKPNKFTGPAWKDAAEVYDRILGGGRPALQELLKLVKDTADPEFASYKPEYVLHGMVLHVGRPEMAKQQALLAELLASSLSDEKVTKATRGLYIRELHWIAGPAQVPALARWVADEELGSYAMAALVAIGKGAVPALSKALGAAKGRHQLAIIQALGRLQATTALPELRRLMLHGDRDVRIAACWAVANLGDAMPAQGMLKLADGGDDWEKPQVTKACLVLAEKLVEAGKLREAIQMYQHLHRTRTGEKEKYLREAAAKALAALNIAV